MSMVSALFIVVMAFITATLSGVFGMAGGLVLMGGLAVVLPVSAAFVTPCAASAARTRSMLKPSTPRQKWLMLGGAFSAGPIEMNCGPAPTRRIVFAPVRA